MPKKYLVPLILVLTFIISFGGVLLYRKWALQTSTEPVKVGVTLNNEYNNKNYRINLNSELPRLNTMLSDEGINIATYTKVINIAPATGDVGNLVYATYDRETEEVFSGFRFNVIPESETVVVNIFLSPTMEDRLILNALNFNYVMALLYAEKHLIYGAEPPKDTYSSLATETEEFYNTIEADNRPITD